MWLHWMALILAWVSMATPALCQSGDGDWGSGFGNYSAIVTTSDTSQAAGDESVRKENNRDRNTSAAAFPPSPSPSPSPSLHFEPRPDRCSVHFGTSPATARRLKAQREELDYLRAVQRANGAVVENLVQFVGAELGDQSYGDVIEESVAGVQEDHERCHEAVEKAEGDLEEQLQGDALDALAGMQKVRAESSAFEDMLRAAADIADRLEISSQALKASFTRQLKDIVKTHG